MRIETLNDFIKWAAQFNDGEYLFRGVSKDCYKIEASACRRLPEGERDNPARLLKVNQELIEKAKGRGHDRKNGQKLSDLELLAELQHFGAATCLIDFSRNALVALWFACQQSSNENQKNGKVFVVRGDDPARFKTVTPDLTEKDIDYFFKQDEHGRYPLYQWEPKFQNNRIIAQHSVFVFGDAQIEAEAECVILQSSKQEILKSLDQLSDITEASMYPDFDGFARLHAHDKPYTEPDSRDLLQRGIEAHQRGVVYGRRDDHERAIAAFSKAIELNPNHANSYYNRGVAYGQTDDYERAIEDFNKAIELNPNHADVYYNRAFICHKRRYYDRAIEDYTKAIQFRPNDTIAYLNRGRAYNSKNKPGRAIADFSKTIELSPNDAIAYYNRGETRLRLGEWEKAKSDLTTAKERRVNIINEFGNIYTSVANFQRKTGITLPEDIAEMLTSI